MTHTCPPLLHWTSFGYPLLKLLTGSIIFLLLLNQLPRSSPSVFFPLPVADCTGALSAPVWSTHTELLNKIESKAFCLTDSLPLTDCFQTLTLCHNVASLTIFYRYFHANCSFELANCMLPSLPQPRRTWFSTHSHPYSVHLPYARVNQYLHSFFPSTDKLWNSLSS